MRAVIAHHITDLTRYTGNGLEHQRSDEATVSIIGTSEELRRIEKVGYSGYQVYLDHDKQQARHENHLDPAIPFELGTSHVLQIFFYGLKPNPADLIVDIEMADGRSQTLQGDLHPLQQDIFTSRMSGTDDWSLIIEAKSEVDLITQSKIGVREEETRRLLEPGRHQIEVKPTFAERYALCLSPANDPFGSIEVKHSFLGEVGAASGRFLWSKKKLWLPPTRTLPSYVSLIVDCVSDPVGPETVVEWRDADEVEVIASLENATEVQAALCQFPGLRSRITVADKGFHENIDIALIEPGEYVPSNWTGKVSCLLFDDQASASFRSRLEATTSWLKHEQNLSEMALEGLWMAAEGNYLTEGRSAAYGVAWTTSSQSEQKGRVSLLRTMATETEGVKADIRRFAAHPFSADVFKST